MQTALSFSDGQPEERIHAIRDRLADYGSAQIDDALSFLLEALCGLVGAQNADWLGFARLAGDGGAPPATKPATEADGHMRRFEQVQAHPIAKKMVGMTDSLRACRLRDLMPFSWFAESPYRSHYADCGHIDAVYIAIPISEDTESYFGVFRAPGFPPFTEKERDQLAEALRGIKRFHRQLLLSHGLLVADTPLTDTERRVLQGLLGGQPEKLIAAGLGQSYHTTHKYVSAIYRKFGVNNRAELMALWLGKA